jgi:DNA (cytosine-5)-methyltransferase 3A
VPTRQRVEINENPQKANCISTVSKDSMVAEPVKSTNKFQEIQSINPDKSDCLIAGYYKAPFNQSTTGVMISAPERIGELNGLSKAQGNRIYSVRGKSVCLNANGGGGGAKTGLYKVDLPDGDYIIRKLTPVECARLQTMPDHWCDGISATQQYKCYGNGWTVDVIAHIFKQLPTE